MKDREHPSRRELSLIGGVRRPAVEDYRFAAERATEPTTYS
jgi:hypothetical protein